MKKCKKLSNAKKGKKGTQITFSKLNKSKKTKRGGYFRQTKLFAQSWNNNPKEEPSFVQNEEQETVALFQVRFRSPTYSGELCRSIFVISVVLNKNQYDPTKSYLFSAHISYEKGKYLNRMGFFTKFAKNLFISKLKGFTHRIQLT